MSMIDITSRLSKERARKVLLELRSSPERSIVSFTSYCKKRMKQRNLTTVDIYNVLKKGSIYNDPEYENGAYRYRVETRKIVVMIEFTNPNIIRCITTWRE